MSLDDFHLAASRAFGDAWVKTTIELCTGYEAQRYCVTVLPQAPDEAGYADAATPEEAIRVVRERFAKQREDKMEEARKLLGIAELPK